jgi:sulfate permease, SulP family
MHSPAPDTLTGDARVVGRLRSLRLPSRSDLVHDVVAGVTVGASQVGNAMAYTMLTGAPPVYGLYAVAAGTPAGALATGSQRMPIVPTAALCLAAGGALATFPSEQRVAGLFTLAVLTGAIMLVLGLLKAGGLVRFISNAVMIGLMAGIGVTILLSQLGALTGFSSRYDNKVLKAADLFMHPSGSDVPTMAIGLVTVVLVVVLRRTRLKLFAMALALLVMTVAVALIDLPSVAVVGDIAPIPRALPWPHLPDLSLLPALALPALSLVIIGLVQGAGISRTVPNSDGSHGDTSRDFVGQGVANVVSGVFSGGVAGGSVQATALNIGAGARTRWSSVFTAVFVIVVILAAAPLVQQVPLAVTAGILIVAATSALQPRAARDVWRADKMSAAIMIVTFGLVLAIPLQYAVLAGAAISVVKYIYISSLDVHVKQVELCDGGLPRESEPPRELSSEAVTVLDIYGSLFFAAAPKIRECLPDVGEAHCPVVVLRLRGRGTLHSATIAMIRDYAVECEARGGRLYLAGVGSEMEEQLQRTGVLEQLGPDAVVAATDEIYGACATAQQLGRTWLAAHADGSTSGPTAV